MSERDDKVGEYYQVNKTKPEPRRYDPPRPATQFQVKTISPNAIKEIMEMFRARQRGEISEEVYADFLKTLKKTNL